MARVCITKIMYMQRKPKQFNQRKFLHLLIGFLFVFWGMAKPKITATFYDFVNYQARQGQLWQMGTKTVMNTEFDKKEGEKMKQKGNFSDGIVVQQLVSQ